MGQDCSRRAEILQYRIVGILNTDVEIWALGLTRSDITEGINAGVEEMIRIYPSILFL